MKETKEKERERRRKEWPVPNWIITRFKIKFIRRWSSVTSVPCTVWHSSMRYHFECHLCVGLVFAVRSHQTSNPKWELQWVPKLIKICAHSNFEMDAKLFIIFEWNNGILLLFVQPPTYIWTLANSTAGQFTTTIPNSEWHKYRRFAKWKLETLTNQNVPPRVDYCWETESE